MVFPEGKGNRYAQRMQTHSMETGVRYWWVGSNPDGGVTKYNLEQVMRLAFGAASTTSSS